MDNEIKVFSNTQFGEIRTATGASGEPLFCLADVCKALGLHGGAKNAKSRLNEKGVVIINTLTNGGEQQLNFITEPNLYKCIFQSRKKEAEAFQDWVTGEVLPSIRRTGGYMAAKADDTPEEIMARALAIANETLARRENRIAQLEAESRQQQRQIESRDEQISLQRGELEKAAPKVSYYDDVLQSTNTMTTTQIAKSLGMEAQGLNRKLKEAGVIYSQSGMWMLMAPYSRWQLSAVRTQTFTRSDGSVGTSSYTVWNERGRRFICALAENGWNARKAVEQINGERKEDVA